MLQNTSGAHQRRPRAMLKSSRGKISESSPAAVAIHEQKKKLSVEHSGGKLLDLTTNQPTLYHRLLLCTARAKAIDSKPKQQHIRDISLPALTPTKSATNGRQATQCSTRPCVNIITQAERQFSTRSPPESQRTWCLRDERPVWFQCPNSEEHPSKPRKPGEHHRAPSCANNSSVLASNLVFSSAEGFATAGALVGASTIFPSISKPSSAITWFTTPSASSSTPSPSNYKRREVGGMGRGLISLSECARIAVFFAEVVKK